MTAFMEIRGAEAIRDGEMRAITLQGRRVLLARVEGRLYAVGAICSHEEAHLDQGLLDGCNVICPLHFGAFDVRTGQVTAPPPQKPIPVYEVKEEQDRVFVSMQPVVESREGRPP